MNVTNSTSTEWDSLKLFNLITRPTLCVFAFFGNLLTLVVIYRFRKLRTIYNATITSLAVADMLVGFTGFTLYILNIKTVNANLLPEIAYFTLQLVAGLYGISMYSSFIHLIILSIERCIAIFLPLRYTSIVNKTFIKIVLPSTWILASILSLTYLLQIYFPQHAQFLLLCGIAGTYIVYSCILFSLSVMGIKSITIVRNKRNILPCQGKKVTVNNVINQATKRIAIILLIFIITYTPGCFLTFAYINAEKYKYFLDNYTPLFNNVTIINCCFNIIIYSATSHKFKAAYIEQIQCLFSCIPYKQCARK